ncbi:MAG TPA: prenyltransferase, partial [Candidatus Korarchaeota archaeon]|nr:prenyltransferase [Candidatus Korarchaeota archaeon]
EFAAGVNFGPLMVLGAYYVQTGEIKLNPLLASVPIGLGVANLLLLNEFPDVDADARGGRRTIPIVLGRRAAARVLAACYALAFALIPTLILAGVLPAGAVLGVLAALPALKAVRGALKYFDDVERLIPAMAANIQAALMIPFLMTLGIVAQGILF